jgi:zinc protease
MKFLLLVMAMSWHTHSYGANTSFEVKKLSTGLDVVLMDSPKVPLVTICLASKAGGFTETPETNGMTHLWEHMFFKGNKRLPDQEAFNRRIRQLGITYNGDTSAEKVRYYFTLPSAYLEEGLQFMADAIATPLLNKVELEKERRVVIDEYDRNAANPAFDFRNLNEALIYGNLAYLRDALGFRSLIEGATREQMFKIKKEVFVPSNSAILIGGDFDKTKVMGLIEKHFKDWKDPKDWKPIKQPPFPPFPSTKSFVMTRPHVRTGSVQVTFAGPRARKQPADTFAADVLISLLNHRSGKFYKKFIDSGLTYGAGLSYYTQSQAGELTLYASVKPENLKKAQKLLMEEAPKWATKDYFTDSQLQDVRRSLIIDHKREVNKPSAYTKTLAFWWAITGLDYYKTYVDNLRKIGLGQVQAFVKKWLVGKQHISSVLISPEDAKVAGLKDTSEPLVQKYLSAYIKDRPENRQEKKVN